MFLTKFNLKYDNICMLKYHLLKKNNEFIIDYNLKYRPCDFKLYKEKVILNQFNIKNNFLLYNSDFIDKEIDYNYLNYKNKVRLNEFLIENNFNENKLNNKYKLIEREFKQHKK